MTKRILITGENSYIGNQLAEWLNKEPEKYTIVKESVRDGKWKEINFSNFDVVVHVAGIAHQDTKKGHEDLYYKVNTDLTIDIATKAKVEGVKQFIFMSSIIVYGTQKKIIYQDTNPNPDNFYGKSKLQAELGILPLQDEIFKIVILRPPMIYGKGSKGNYLLLSKLARLTPIFPDYDNRRSMIHIDNLTEIIRLIIDNKDAGIFFPQNEEYVKTSDMVKMISRVHNKPIFQTSIFNTVIRRLTRFNFFNKVFGNLVYDQRLSEYKVTYKIRNFEESVKRTER